MNKVFYKNFDTNFQKACELSEKNFSHTELIKLLRYGDVMQKQIAAMHLDGIYNRSDADAIMNNLTGCDGKIREAAALTLSRLLKEDKQVINFLKHYPEIFADASIDMNGNICRYITKCVSVLRTEPDFCDKYLKKIFSFIDEAFDGLDRIIYKDKKYVINKLLFKLYWCLEDLRLFTDTADKNILLKILTKTSNIKEYTIREKTATVLRSIDDTDFADLKEKLANDENYYVRKVLA